MPQLMAFGLVTTLAFDKKTLNKNTPMFNAAIWAKN